MPLFRRTTAHEGQSEDERRRRRQDAERDQKVSLEGLASGGLPAQAVRRLEETRRHPESFTSDLSVDEFLLVKEAGLQPITQVMGSSVYHVGFQSGMQWGFRVSQELQTITQAMNQVRAVALGRLEQEAGLVGADAVVGVRIRRGEHDWATDHVEFHALGTAVRVREHEPGGKPALTNLSGQDYWKLTRAGYRPMGVVAASTAYYVVASWATQVANTWYGGLANQELQDFTAGLYQARHLVMERVHRQARDMRAAGVVGVVIERSERPVEIEGRQAARTDLIFTFDVVGTAIAEPSKGHAPRAIGKIVTLDGGRQTQGG